MNIITDQGAFLTVNETMARRLVADRPARIRVADVMARLAYWQDLCALPAGEQDETDDLSVGGVVDMILSSHENTGEPVEAADVALLRMLGVVA